MKSHVGSPALMRNRARSSQPPNGETNAGIAPQGPKEAQGRRQTRRTTSPSKRAAERSSEIYRGRDFMYIITLCLIKQLGSLCGVENECIYIILKLCIIVGNWRKTLGCSVLGRLVGMHPIAYREPQGGSSNPSETPPCVTHPEGVRTIYENL